MTKRVEAVKAVRDMGDDELADHVHAQRRRLLELRFQQATGQVENHRQLRYIRREVARALTIAGQNARGETPVAATGSLRPAGPAASGSAASSRLRPRGDAGGKAPAAAIHEEQRREGALRRQDPEAADASPDEDDVSLSEVEPGEEDDAEDTVESEDDDDE